MPKINKVTKYAVQWLHSTGLSYDDIAKELSISVNQVVGVLKKTVDEVKIKTTTSKAQNLMITHTSGKKINSVAIMTKEASELGDEARNKASTKTREVKGIFRPKN